VDVIHREEGGAEILRPRGEAKEMNPTTKQLQVIQHIDMMRFNKVDGNYSPNRRQTSEKN
jgi:hypothetical protein